MFLFYLKDGDLMEELKKKDVFQDGNFNYLDKKKISPALFLEEQESCRAEGGNPDSVKSYIFITGLSKNGKLDIDSGPYGMPFQYLMKALPDKVFVVDAIFSDDKDILPYWKNGEMYNPDTGTNVYGQTTYVSKDRIKPASDKDKVNVEMYVEFGKNNYLNDVRHCYLTLPKEDMYESKDLEGNYYFYLREPEVELNSLDNKGEKFKVEAEFITLFHHIGEYINESHEIEKRKKQEKDVADLAETIRDRDSVDYELF